LQRPDKKKATRKPLFACDLPFSGVNNSNFKFFGNKYIIIILNYLFVEPYAVQSTIMVGSICIPFTLLQANNGR
jgi:hypothetical protein